MVLDLRLTMKIGCRDDNLFFFYTNASSRNSFPPRYKQTGNLPLQPETPPTAPRADAVPRAADATIAGGNTEYPAQGIPAPGVSSTFAARMIKLQHITKEFRQKNRVTVALSNVSLHVPEGKIMGVTGESGAGKSTLIRCVNLLEHPTSGEVIVNGTNLMKLSASELSRVRRNIGMIFQHFNLLASRNVFDNVAFPLELTRTPRKEIRERVFELLALAGIEHKAYDYPAQLSGGQKQRVAIARALANRPGILLCDEATSALDPSTTRNILALLKEINNTMRITILLITHQTEVVKAICNDVVVLREGKLAETDPDHNSSYYI
jgi:ABC-type methionine transport system ATPase subunit